MDETDLALIQVLLDYSPLRAIGLPFLSRPTVEVDSVEYRPWWGLCMVAVKPGKHIVKIQSIGYRRGQHRSYAELDVRPGKTVMLKYNAMQNGEVTLASREMNGPMRLDAYALLALAAKQVVVLAVGGAIVFSGLMMSILHLADVLMSAFFFPALVIAMVGLTKIAYDRMQRQQHEPLHQLNRESDHKPGDSQ